MRRTIPLLAAAVGLAAWASPGRAGDPAVIRIGMLSSMFRDVKPAMVNALAKPFHSLVATQTGLKSELVLVPTADDMRQQLNDGKLQFGVFHGFEFAWMVQRSPELQPLMVTAPLHRPLKAFLVVHATNPAKCLADLKGKTLAVSKGTREHVRLFVERHCLKEGTPLLQFFAQVTSPSNPENALHDVADNRDVQAAVVDGAAIQCFADRNPGRYKRIKILAASDAFPESVVAYRHGMIHEETVRRFRDGMNNAHATPLGRQLLSLWSMAGFQPIPPNYRQQLAVIAKAYPPLDAPAAE